MGQQVNLLKSLPQIKRNAAARAEDKSENVIAIARLYGEAYFDGDRKYGYGGYYHDGRWHPVAKEIVSHYKLRVNAKVLDVGCAKGFLVDALRDQLMDAYGQDISRYAIDRCPHKMRGRLHLGWASDLPFPDNSFDLVISLNTIHNLPRWLCKIALQEIQRVSKGKAFVQVDSYRTLEEKAVFEDWVLTAKFHDYPDGWLALFDEAGYTGDYDWTLV